MLKRRDQKRLTELVEEVEKLSKKRKDLWHTIIHLSQASDMRKDLELQHGVLEQLIMSKKDQIERLRRKLEQAR